MVFLQKNSQRNAAADTPVTNLHNSDKLSLTLSIAIVIHFFIILGISFVPEATPPKHRYNSIEVTLVQHESSKAPKEATALAQKNLDSGNFGDENVNPLEKTDAPIPDEQPELTVPPQMLPNPPENLSDDSEAEPVAEASPIEPEQEQFMTKEADLADVEQAQIPDAKAETPAEPANELPPQVAATHPLPSTAELIASSFKIAALSAQIQRRLANKSKRPRRKFIAAATREYRFAAYMEAWRAKVERVGNLNYPQDVRKNELSGSLILDVALLPDGSIDSISVKRSSNNPVLDKAAIKIVKIAAPYAEFPDSFSKEIDILHITRTWRFSNNKVFQ